MSLWCGDSSGGSRCGCRASDSVGVGNPLCAPTTGNISCDDLAERTATPRSAHSRYQIGEGKREREGEKNEMISYNSSKSSTAAS